MKLRKINSTNTSAAFASLALVYMLAFSGCKDTKTDSGQPLTMVKFGLLPYGDHSQAIIGIQKGWFKEVGIDLQYNLIKIEGVVPELNNKRYDVVSTPPGVILSSYDNAKDLCSFVFADVFQGFAIMAQPGKFKSYDDFIKTGLSPDAAVKAAILQLKGKTFAYPAETSVKPFIDILLEKGAMTRKDFKSIVQDDALNINTMRSKKADFQVGGAPSRIALQKEGFQPIISAIDIVKSAKPSPDSKELASVFQDGWAARKDYYTQNKPVIYRMASVCFRISDYIKSHPDSALAIHMPYLSKITGEKFTVADGKIIYSALDPFFSFNDQNDWFNNPHSPLYYKNLYGSLINNFKDQKLYKNSVPAVDDIIYADDVYKEMVVLRDKATANIKSISEKNLANDDAKKQKLEKAKFFLNVFDYYDAEQLSGEILK
jgi:ABC-type nitrate/sulfonate/bicarbonate transport system substrate-binding protein